MTLNAERLLLVAGPCDVLVMEVQGHRLKALAQRWDDLLAAVQLAADGLHWHPRLWLWQGGPDDDLLDLRGWRRVGDLPTVDALLTVYQSSAEPHVYAVGGLMGGAGPVASDPT